MKLILFLVLCFVVAVGQVRDPVDTLLEWSKHEAAKELAERMILENKWNRLTLEQKKEVLREQSKRSVEKIEGKDSSTRVLDEAEAMTLRAFAAKWREYEAWWIKNGDSFRVECIAGLWHVKRKTGTAVYITRDEESARRVGKILNDGKHHSVSGFIRWLEGKNKEEVR